MTKLKKAIYLIFLGCFMAASNLYADCTSPNADIELGVTLGEQKLDNRVNELYYKIELNTAGRLNIWTTEDSANQYNRVNTYGELLDSSCNKLDISEDIRGESPRYFRFDTVLKAGIYYLKVENKSSLDDDGNQYARGYFQLKNDFTPTLNDPSIIVGKYTDKQTVNSGEAFKYIISVYNNSKVEHTSVVVKDNIDPQLILVENWNLSSDYWDCSNVGNSITCELKDTQLPLEPNDYARELRIQVKAPEVTEDIDIANTAIVTVPQASGEDTTTVVIKPKKELKHILSLKLSDTPDPVDIDSTYYYDLDVKNETNKNLSNVIIQMDTTSYFDYIFEGFSSGDDWICTKEDKRLKCELKPDLPANANMKLRITAKSTPREANIWVKAEAYLADFDKSTLKNNKVYEGTRVINKELGGQNPRDFTKVHFKDGLIDMNTFGDIITIGNQSICEKSGGNCKEPSDEVNDRIEQKYINLDTSPLADNFKTATSAKLNIEASDEILWAGLYWMGRIDKGIGGWTTLRKKTPKVYLRHDLNSSKYIEVQSDRNTTAIDNSGNIITVDKFNFINSSSYFNYQGMADVTEYIRANRGGKYWVADVVSSEGFNISAGWNLVVIVRDTKDTPSRELKNITLYDGYKGVWKAPDNKTSKIYTPTIEQEVSGFLTPSAGDITSKLIFFAFEGDLSLPDFIEVDGNRLKNDKNLENDVVNGTISKDGIILAQREPNLDNTSGIDVDEFNLGTTNGGPGIIKLGQTSAKISIGSLGLASNNNGGDQFFLGMFGFSTNLNDPVCYMETFTDDSFTAKLQEGVRPDDIIGVNVEFRNKETQTLLNVHSFIDIDKIFREDNSSFKLKNIAEASFTKQDGLFGFKKIQKGDENITEVTTSIGLNASSGIGGSLESNETVHIRFLAAIRGQNDDNLTKNRYSVSYDPNPDKKVEVSRCAGEGQKLHIIKNIPNGFEVTRPNGLRGGDGVSDGFENGDRDKPSNENHLFTQVLNKNFDADIVALKDDKEDEDNKNRVRTDQYKGLVQVEIVDFNKSNPSCESFTPISQPKYVVFDNDTIVNAKDFNATLVDQDAFFRVRYLVDDYDYHAKWKNVSGNLSDMQDMLKETYYGKKRCQEACFGALATKQTCKMCIFKDKSEGGLSKFSCASDAFSIKPGNIEFNLADENLTGGKQYLLNLDANSKNYNHNAGNLSMDINETNANCTSLEQNLTAKFIGGEANITNFSYPNVGNVKARYLDLNWTIYDQNITSEFSDCVMGSSSNMINMDGKVGCEIEDSRSYTFIPHKFMNVVSLKNAQGEFNYMADSDENVSARLELNTTAVIFGGAAATNYSDGCFAKDINVQYRYLGSKNKVHYIRNTSVEKNKIANFNFSQNEFTNGVANIDTAINFGRNMRRPENPFSVNSNDFNITVSDADGVSGADFNRTDVSSVDFYYGRLNVPDIETPLTSIYVKFHYEVYCDRDCNSSVFTIADGPASADSVFWYINESHILPSQGDFAGWKSQNGMIFAGKSFKGLNVSLGANSAPHNDRISYEPSSWLRFNRFKTTNISSFNISVSSSAGNWSGKGNVGRTVDTNLSIKSSKKMEW